MSSSNSRKRHKTIAIRVDDDEATQLAALAERAGLSVGAFIRQQVIGSTPPRQSRRPPVEKELLSLAMRHMGKIGGNINQLAKHANHGRVPCQHQLEAAANAVQDIRNIIMGALGMKGHHHGGQL